MCLFQKRLPYPTVLMLKETYKTLLSFKQFKEAAEFLAEIVLRYEEQQAYEMALEYLDTLENLLQFSGFSLLQKIALENKRIVLLQHINLAYPQKMLRSYKGIASYAQIVQNYEVSLEYYQLCLQQYQHLSKPNGQEEAELWWALSNVARDMNNMEQAAFYAQESIKALLKNNLQPNYINYNDLAIKTTNTKDKEKWLLKSYDLCLQEFGLKHFDTARQAENLADFYAQQKKIMKSKKYYQQSIEIFQDINRYNKYNFFLRTLTQKMETL